MNVIMVLSVILYLLMKKIGGKEGSKAFWIMVLNLVLFMSLIVLLALGIPAFLLSIVTVVLFSAIMTVGMNERNLYSWAAFLGTVTTILISSLLITLTLHYFQVQGFVQEELADADMFSMYVGIRFDQLTIVVLIMASLGVIIDTSVTLVAYITALKKEQPKIKDNQLLKSAMTVGKDVIISSINTLFFAFFGQNISLFIWVKDLHYSFDEMMNSKVIVLEIITMLYCGIGILLCVPCTFLWVRYISGRKKVMKNRLRKEEKKSC